VVQDFKAHFDYFEGDRNGYVFPLEFKSDFLEVFHRTLDSLSINVKSALLLMTSLGGN
jgi:hypothetical protein